MKDSGTGRIHVHFKDENLLHQFCATFAQNDVPFAYGAGLSVSMSKKDLEQLPNQLRIDFDAHVQKGEISLTDQPPPSGSRKIPNAEEVRDALRKVLPEEFLPTR